MDSEFSSCNMLEIISQHGSSGPLNLPLEYLRNITNDFSDDRLLGQGGFGTVYKGLLPNGETVAVKKFHSRLLPGVKDRQFENEARHLKRLKHPNIVLLLGWCTETEHIYVEYNGKHVCAEKSERLLCLEYMPKGNLRRYLSDESSGLTWETRYKIIEGICYGLHYLHEGSQLNTPIIHMDLKPANILLDKNMVPKIADFGLSRLFSEDKTWTCTTNRDGTLGYMAPEYINRGLISKKSDIFSLGVIIIEIVTGQRDYPDEDGVSSQEYTELVLKNWRHRLQNSLKSTSLEIDCQQIVRCIQIGLDCVKLDRLKRPTINQVIRMLNHEIENVVQSHPPLILGQFVDDNQVLGNLSKLLQEAATLADEAAAGVKAAKEILKSSTAQLDDLCSSSDEMLTVGSTVDDSVRMDAMSLQNGEDSYKPRGTIPSPSNQVQYEWIEQYQPYKGTIPSPSNQVQDEWIEQHQPYKGTIPSPSNQVQDEWIELYQPGIYVTLLNRGDGTQDLERIRYSRQRFVEHQAVTWWNENREKVYERYNVKNPQPVSSVASAVGKNLSDGVAQRLPCDTPSSLDTSPVRPTTSSRAARWLRSLVRLVRRASPK